MRGNWARAWELADSIRTDPVAEPMLPSLDSLRRPASGAGQVGRNRPCPCGSGRKYKSCCLEKDQQAVPHPLAERVAALYAMIATYAQRGPRRPAMDRMLACAVGAPQAAMLALDLGSSMVVPPGSSWRTAATCCARTSVNCWAGG